MVKLRALMESISSNPAQFSQKIPKFEFFGALLLEDVSTGMATEIQPGVTQSSIMVALGQNSCYRVQS